MFTIGGGEGDEDITIPVVGIRADDGKRLLADDADSVPVSFSYCWSSDEEEDVPSLSSSSDEDEEAGVGLGKAPSHSDLLGELLSESTRMRSHSKVAPTSKPA